MELSDVTRLKQGYIRPLPILHCISQLGETKEVKVIEFHRIGWKRKGIYGRCRIGSGRIPPPSAFGWGAGATLMVDAAATTAI